MEKSNYNKKLKYLSRNLRTYGTHGEAKLWSDVLRAKKLYGLQFNRQFAIENYIVDFICRKLKLIIEVDGGSHQHKSEVDEIRDKRLNELGYKITRVSEGEVLNDIHNVIRTIEAELPEEILKKVNPPSPLFKGGRKSSSLA